MKAIIRVFAYEFRRQGRRRAYLFMTIGIPLIAISLFYGYQLYHRLAPSSAESTANALSKNASNDTFRPIGVVDEAGLLNSAPPLFSNIVKFETVANAQAALRDNKIGSFYDLRSDYLQTGRIDMTFDRFSVGNFTSAALSNWIIESIVQQASNADQSNAIKRLEGSPRYYTHNVSAAGSVKATNNGGASIFLAYVVSYALLISAFLTSGYLMASIVEEKESRMIEILLSSMRPVHLLAGKFLALSILSLLQLFCWGLALFYLLRQLPSVIPDLFALQMPNSGQIFVMVLYFILGFLLLSAFYASIGSLVTNMREGPQLAAFISIPFIAPLYALQIIAMAPNGQLAVILSLIPITAPMTMISRAALVDVPFGELIASVVLLVLTILFALWLAGRLFRVSALLSGRTPRLRDIPRLLRAS